MAGKPNNAQSIPIEERRTRAMELSLMGWTYREIVAHGNIGYNPAAKNASAMVAKDISRALADRKGKRDEQALLLIERENVKLDLLERACWQVLTARHYVVNQGVVVWHNPSEEPAGRQKHGWANIRELAEDLEARKASGAQPLEDDAPVLAAVQQLVKIAERRAKLNGFDAPVKKIIEVESGDGVDERIAGLLAELASGGQGTPTEAPATGEVAA